MGKYSAPAWARNVRAKMLQPDARSNQKPITSMELAREVGVSYQFLSDVLRGKREVTSKSRCCEENLMEAIKRIVDHRKEVMPDAESLSDTGRQAKPFASGQDRGL